MMDGGGVERFLAEKVCVEVVCVVFVVVIYTDLNTTFFSKLLTPS